MSNCKDCGGEMILGATSAGWCKAKCDLQPAFTHDDWLKGGSTRLSDHVNITVELVGPTTVVFDRMNDGYPDCPQCGKSELVHVNEGCRYLSCPPWYCLGHHPPYEFWDDEDDD